MGGHLPTAQGAVNLVVVADTDLLADRLWVQTQNLLAQRLSTPFANNGDLVVNALDNLLGSGDLIGMGSRATFQRPFTRVETLRRGAETRFLAAEEGLKNALATTDNRLRQLQAERQDGAEPCSPPPRGQRCNALQPGGSNCAVSCGKCSVVWTRTFSGWAPGSKCLMWPWCP